MTNDFFNCDNCVSNINGFCKDDCCHFYGGTCEDIKQDPNIENDICICWDGKFKKNAKKARCK